MRKIDEATLQTLLGQLIDLKAGVYKELVITEGEYADLLREIILDRIDYQKEYEEIEKTEAIIENL